jgi:hypothetical protein
MSNAELTSGVLIAEAIRKAHDIVNCGHLKFASVLAV